MCRPVVRIAFIVLGVVPAAAHAGIVSLGGAAVLADPPPSILVDQWESNTEIRAFFENQVTLPASLSLDHVNAGLVNDEALLVSGMVTAGTAVQSYMVFADSVGETPALLSGYLLFDTPILGVLTRATSLNDTDGLLGRPGTAYGHHASRRIELDPTGDFFEISTDRLRLDFTLKFGDANDNLRVITAVPEPGAFSLFALGGIASARRRRVRAAAP